MSQEMCQVELPRHKLHGKRFKSREKIERKLVEDPQLMEWMSDLGFSPHKDNLPDFLDKVVVDVIVKSSKRRS